MVTHVTRGRISEFIRLASDTFNVPEATVEFEVRQLLVGLLEAGPQSGVDCLFDHVPGSRDLAFAEMLARDAGVRPKPVSGLPSADLFALFLSYCSAHAGVDCASRLLAAAYRLAPPADR